VLALRPFCHIQKEADYVRLDTDCCFYVSCMCEHSKNTNKQKMGDTEMNESSL